MHELSIAMGMIDELIRIAQDNNAKRVVTVRLRIGKMSGIVIDSLEFAFDVVKSEYPLLSDTKIVIQEVPLVYKCRGCKNTFSPQDETSFTGRLREIYLPSCPRCESYNLDLISGEEMDIEDVEVEI
jgi:hydrogenase nickel incorporation protein HypA/HybF